jgi:hypothetical protein
MLQSHLQVLRAITSQQIQLARTLLDERIAVLSGQASPGGQVHASGIKLSAQPIASE